MLKELMHEAAHPLAGADPGFGIRGDVSRRGI